MGMSIAEKILAKHSDKEEVYAGEYVESKIDLLYMHDGFPIYLQNIIDETGLELPRMWDPDKVVVINKAANPASTIKSAYQNREARKFAKKYGIKHFYDVGRCGVMHDVLADEGFVRPGMLIVGGDSHSVKGGAFNAASTGVGWWERVWAMMTGELYFRVPETIKFVITGKMPEMVMSKDVFLYIAGKYGVDVALYKSIEWTGSTVEDMEMDSRMSLSTSSVELGAKFGLFAADKKCIDWLKPRTDKPLIPVESDPDVEYEETYRIDVEELEPYVALPHDPSNSKPISEVMGIRIDQGVIGSCVNGRFEDIEVAAKILKGKKIHPDVRLIVVPASNEVYIRAADAGLLTTIVTSGGLIKKPSCDGCGGGVVLASGEVSLNATTRNFKGRLGNPEAFVYLASPATVAASVIKGEISDPREMI